MVLQNKKSFFKCHFIIVIEYGDDIHTIADKRALCIVNHLGLMDHFTLMTAFHDKGILAGRVIF